MKRNYDGSTHVTPQVVEYITTEIKQDNEDLYDQSLNTTDDVEFNNIIVNDVVVNEDLTANNIEVKNDSNIFFTNTGGEPKNTMINGDIIESDVVECKTLGAYNIQSTNVESDNVITGTIQGKHAFSDSITIVEDTMINSLEETLAEDAKWWQGYTVQLTRRKQVWFNFIFNRFEFTP